MSKKAKLILIISAITAVILIVLFSSKAIKNQDEGGNYNPEYGNSNEEENLDYENQVLEPSDSVVFPSDLIGTWLTETSGSDEDPEYQGFVLRPNGTALSINNSIDYKSWRIDDYKLIFTPEDSEVEMDYIVDYIGKEGLILRVGDTTTQYTLESK